MMQKVVFGNKRCFISGAQAVGSQPKMDVRSEDGQEKHRIFCSMDNVVHELMGKG